MNNDATGKFQRDDAQYRENQERGKNDVEEGFFLRGNCFGFHQAASGRILKSVAVSSLAVCANGSHQSLPQPQARAA